MTPVRNSALRSAPPAHLLGIDAGSTTVKITLLDPAGNTLLSFYQRHRARVSEAVLDLLRQLHEQRPDLQLRLAITGSAGLGIAERANLPFVQEVVAASRVVETLYPDTSALVDVGGEDAKMIFFPKGHAPDIRMNGSCAGGTGAFIDQMATLLDIPVEQLDGLAASASRSHPIASRCGVFSKTDIQNLVARGIATGEIARSIFHAVALQVLTALSRGYTLRGPVLLCGGPLTYIPVLREELARVARLQPEDLILPPNSDTLPALGAALMASSQTYQLPELIEHLQQALIRAGNQPVESLLPPLFFTDEQFDRWRQAKARYRLPTATPRETKGAPLFLGIDSGSTTTKLVVALRDGRILFRHYSPNRGNALRAVQRALQAFQKHAESFSFAPTIAAACVTGYGEELIRTAFQLPFGIVETIAHYRAAAFFDPRVSFILDIGGQDMKAIFVDNGTITRLDINEACSSGSGSFIETFAQGLGFDAPGFALEAVRAENPVDLGSRCTVFMNSSVKQAQRAGAPIPDIAAGLAYSVVRNCLRKVLRLSNYADLGSTVMLQGGTFRSPAVARAFEIESQREAIITDSPELMGAFGAALHAAAEANNSIKPIPLQQLVEVASYSDSQSVCQGCKNHCVVTHLEFGEGRAFHTGNRCERIYSNQSSAKAKQGANLSLYKHRALRRLVEAPKDPRQAPHVGIPMVLGLYENLPFWATFLRSLGVKVSLSPTSSPRLAEAGARSVMSDNICYPAKLVHGHAIELAKMGVDRILLPFVVYERDDIKGADNSYNCPIVSGYSEVVKAAVDLSIPIDAPTISFRDPLLLIRQLQPYAEQLLGGKVSSRQLASLNARAVREGLRSQETFDQKLRLVNRSALDAALGQKRLVIMLAGRPYHADPYIQHDVARTLAQFGAQVVTEDLVRGASLEQGEVPAVNQWAYTSRIMAAAQWVASQGELVQFVQITSFGCGPDAMLSEAIATTLRRAGKSLTLLKVDDVANPGSLRLRIRSLVESLQLQKRHSAPRAPKPASPREFSKEERHRTILMPWFADGYSPFLPPLFAMAGYKAVNLPPPGPEQEQAGLRFANNEVCYPATLIVGSLMHAVESGQYEPEQVAFGITQTGGQCRATNYLAMVQRALHAAGLEEVPIISVGVGSPTTHRQEGFSIPWLKMAKHVLRAMAYADTLRTIYMAALPRERTPNSIQPLYEHYTSLGVKALEEGDSKSLYRLIDMAVSDFTGAIRRVPLPRIGIVGEIFVKYNRYANRGVIDWLVRQGVEPVVPPLTEFFLEGLASRKARTQAKLERSNNMDHLLPLMEGWIFSIIRRMERAARAFPFYRPIARPSQASSAAAPLINLNAQFGEGWLIPAEFARFAQEGVYSVLCLQPFGCIANHIVAKGIERKVKRLFSDMSLLYLDVDSGVSEANFANRLFFLKDHALRIFSRTSIINHEKTSALSD